MSEEAFNDDLPLWRVGVVVFVSARGVDYGDVCSIAARAVEQTLPHGDIVWGRPDGKHWRARVAEVIELSMASGNGYTYTLPSTKAWRQYDNGESGALPESLTRSFDPADRDDDY